MIWTDLNRVISVVEGFENTDFWKNTDLLTSQYDHQKMTFSEFTTIYDRDAAAASLPPLLLALWLDKHGLWHDAHDLVDDKSSSDACWIHAYLHRKEGDQWNANYWYNRANRSMPDLSLDEEWTDLVRHMLPKH